MPHQKNGKGRNMRNEEFQKIKKRMFKLSEEDYKFKGGYIAIIEQYEYASVWHNNRIVRRFKSFKTLNAFLEKNYKDFEIELY